MARFLSPEWVEAGRQIVDDSAEFRQAAKGLTATVLTEITNAPDGQTHYLFHEVVEGRMPRAQVNGDLADRSAEVRITAAYDTFRRLHEGRLTIQGAYFNGLVRLKGNAQLAMRFAPALVKYQELVRRVETSF